MVSWRPNSTKIELITNLKKRTMKNKKKSLSHALYLLLPLCFFAMVYLLVAFTVWESNPQNMSFDTREFIAFFGFLAMVSGVLVAYIINNGKQKN